MSRRLRRTAAALAVMLGVATPWALGSGFHIYEQGAKASGQAVAFAARADDASAVYYNPAAMAWLDGREASIGVSAVFIGDTTFDSQMNELPGPAGSLFSGGMFDMVGNTRYVPHAYYAKGAGDGRVAYGLGVFAPFGLVTEWEEDFDGRFSARKSDLETYVINPNVAYRFADRWAVAFGIDLLEAELNHFSRNLPPGTSEDFNLFDLQGEGDKTGWNAALSYRGDEWAFGLTYRSGFEVELKGQAILSGPLTVPGGSPAVRAAATPVLQLRQNASGTIDLPETWSVGIAYLGLEHWELEFDLHKINWSSFEKLPISLSAGLPPGGGPTELVSREDWVDTSSWRFGASRKVSERSEMRLGIYWEDRTIPQRTLRPSIPDSDRTGLTFGWGYSVNDALQLDAFWMHIETATRSTSLQDYAADPSVPAGTYDSKIDLIGVTLGFKI